VLKWLREAGCPWGEETNAAAAKGGHFEVLKWLMENGCIDEESPTLCETLVEAGNIEHLKWARSKGCEWSQESHHHAIKSGSIEMLEYVNAENEHLWDYKEEMCRTAAIFGK